MSKYVRQTGDGYVGRYGTANGKATITVTQTDLDWSLDDEVVAVPEPDCDGVRITKDPDDDAEQLGTYHVQDSWGQFVAISGASIRELDVSGGDVRVYEREASLLVVPAESDVLAGENE